MAEHNDTRETGMLENVVRNSYELTRDFVKQSTTYVVGTRDELDTVPGYIDAFFNLAEVVSLPILPVIAFSKRLDSPSYIAFGAFAFIATDFLCRMHDTTMIDEDATPEGLIGKIRRGIRFFTTYHRPKT